MRPVKRFTRQEFLTERWAYRPGEHVTFVAPTQDGKTTFGFQLLEYTASSSVPAVAMIMKPRDKTVRDWQKKLQYRIVKDWPPNPNPFIRKPNGYILWPVQKPTVPEVDRLKLQRVMERCLLDGYSRGNRILFCDEAYGFAARLDLSDEMVAIWTQGASMGCGMWAATQRPSYIPLWAYNQAEHVFLGGDPDERSIKRFSEIGGINPKIIQREIAGLSRYEYLYVKRTGRAVCVIESE